MDDDGCMEKGRRYRLCYGRDQYIGLKLRLWPPPLKSAVLMARFNFDIATSISS